MQDSDLLRAAAHTGFLLNLFNLLPIVPLDGGRAMAAIHPSLWIAGLAGLAVLLVFSPNAILDPDPAARRPRGLGALALAQGRRDRELLHASPASQRVADRACLYIGIAAACVVGMRAGYVNT